jgi:hypothetical protein
VVAVGDDGEAQVVEAAEREEVVRLLAAPPGLVAEAERLPLGVVVLVQLLKW